jgi:hypothetical protein
VIDFASLLAEFEGPDAFGPLIYETLLDVTARVARRYPPDRYGAGAEWDDDAFAVLAHDVAADRLVDQKQLAYAFSVARSCVGRELDVVRGLIGRQVRLVLMQRYRRDRHTLVDFEWDCMMPILNDEPYEDGWRPKARHAHDAARPRDLNDPTPADIDRAAWSLRSVPRQGVQGGPSPRAIYRPVDRVLAVGLVATALDDVTPNDLRRVLEAVLTPWLVVTLEPDVNAVDLASSDDPVETAELALAIFDALTPMQRFVLFHMMCDRADREIADMLGVGRTAITMRRQKINDEIRSILADVDIDVARATFDELRRLLATGHGGELGA